MIPINHSKVVLWAISDEYSFFVNNNRVDWACSLLSAKHADIFHYLFQASFMKNAEYESSLLKMFMIYVYVQWYRYWN